MSTFGKRIADLRKERKMTQDELAKKLKTSISVIGRYERDEMTPSVDVAKNIAKFLNTTVGYLLGENEDAELFKDPIMLQRLKEISTLPERDKDCIFYAIDNILQNVRTKKAFSAK